MKTALVVGGANGIGLAISHVLAAKNEYKKIIIVDRSPIIPEYDHHKFESHIFDLENQDYSFFNQFKEVDTLMITAGFGKLALFENLSEEYIISSLTVNTLAPIRIIKIFYDKLKSEAEFYCGIMVSIAGFMSSPFFSVYGATKAALKIFIESINVELDKGGSLNRILNVSPGSIKGTSFNKGKTDLDLTSHLAKQIVENLESRNDLFIPQYDEVYKNVLDRYSKDFREEGRHSYEYKLKSGRTIIK